MIISKQTPEFPAKLDLFTIEYICKYISGFKKIGFIIPLSAFISYKLSASLTLLSLVTVFLDCCIRDRGNNYVIIYDKLPDIEGITDYTVSSVGYIEGNSNYITSWMVLPCYQKKGIGKQLLDEYLKTYAKKKKTYYFNTSRLLDLFYMKDKFNIKNIMTTNYYNYTIECYI
tara:strand:+ start:23 stop:538 length:516 start_codon:yes stop_codon:yes gene_type:complete